MQKKYRFLAFLLTVAMLPSLLGACKEDEWQDPTLCDLTWAVGAPLPTAEDFCTALPEGGALRFADENVSFDRLGKYELSLIYTAPDGREQNYVVHLTLALDVEPPVISGAKDLSAYVGEGIAYRSGVTVSDNFEGKVTLDVDASAVNTMEEGSYPVTYTARDNAGNETTVTVTVWIWREVITEAMLWEKIDALIAQRIPNGASAERAAREIYSYVHENIAYTATSDKSDWIRAAYEGLRAGSGDCFTYFAISKAFFMRLGIQTMDIQRTPGLVDERHYWNFVNVGTEADPLWYHFDATRLAGVQHDGCLLTDSQVDAYSAKRVDEFGNENYFYAYDKTAYPASATRIITETPSLEPYA